MKHGYRGYLHGLVPARHAPGAGIALNVKLTPAPVHKEQIRDVTHPHSVRGGGCGLAQQAVFGNHSEAVLSLSRPKNPCDNTQTEVGWSMLKTELLPHGTTFAYLEVAHYLDTYFNLDRRHSALGYCSHH